MTQVAVKLGELLGTSNPSTLRRYRSALRRGGYPISGDGILFFESDVDTEFQRPILKKRYELAEAFRTAALARNPEDGKALRLLIQSALPGIMKGSLEGDALGPMCWLRRRCHSKFVSFLESFLTDHNLLPKKMPSFSEYNSTRIRARMGLTRWEGVNDEDQNLMRQFLIYRMSLNSEGGAVTIKAAFNHLHFIMRSHKLASLRTVRPEEINALVEELIKRGFKRRSQYQIIARLKQFFLWLVEEKGFAGCPVLRRHFPRFTKPDPVPLTPDQVRAIRSVLDERYVGSMVRAFFYLIYLTGLRKTEAMSVRLCDIDRDRGELFVAHGKGDKPRHVPIVMYAIERIDEWLAQCPPPAGCEYIFHLNGLQIGPDLARKMRWEIAEASNVGFTWRQLRTTFATRLAEYKVGPFAIKELLGHEDLSTVMAYVNIADPTVREGYSKFADQLTASPGENNAICLGTAAHLVDSKGPDFIISDPPYLPSEGVPKKKGRSFKRKRRRSI